MEVKINLNRRTFFDALVVIELVLLIVYGVQLSSISKKLAGGSPAPTVAAPSRPSAPEAGPSAAGKVKPIDATDYVRGDKKAPLSLIEYSDYECPFCKRFHPTVVQLMKEYKGKVKWVYRHFPLSRHANAQKEAEAAECIGSLGDADKYWEYTDKIFERTTANGTGFALADLPKLAAEVGVNQKKFEECLNSDKFAAKVQKDLEEGSAAGVNGTPGSILLVDKTGDSQLIEGAQSYDFVKKAIETALKKL